MKLKKIIFYHAVTMIMGAERKLHWLIWTASIIYSLYKFKKSCEHQPHNSPDDFEEGWSIFKNHMKDSSDLEWLILTSVFKKFYVLLMIEVVCVQIIRRIRKTVIPYFYSIFPLICLNTIVGSTTTGLFVLYPAVMFVIHTNGRKSFCYLLTLCALLFLHGSHFKVIKASLSMGETETFLFDVGVAWIMIKSLSFAVDRINANVYKNWTLKDISCVLSYSLYLPSIFTGPIVCYDKFSDQVLKTAKPLSLKELKSCILRLIYQISFYFLYELFLHFIFSSAVQFYPSIVKNYDGWSLCGLGYALPMMFFLKYFVIYGVSNAFAKFEDIELPPPPKCISCLHLSSYLWRHFDRGLYLWILKYLYYPLMNNNWNSLKKMCAVCLCFAFVCLWHGMDQSICLSSALNCVLVISEIAMKFLLSTKIRKYFEKLPVAMQTRIRAAVVAPHFFMMCISCTFFLSNFDIGILMVKRIILGGIFPLGPLLLIMYCGCHVSMDSKRKTNL